MTPTANKQISLDPHAYHPIVVDDALLTDRDRRDALEEELRNKLNGLPEPDWRSHLTREELQDYDTWTKQPSFPISGSSAQREARELIRIGLRRGYARDKYNGGQHAWYGDGLPPWLQARD